MVRSFVLTFLALTSIHSMLIAQQSREVVDQPTEWFATTSSMKMSPKFSLYLDGQYRFVKDFQPMQFQIRVGGDFKMSEKLSLMPLGYVYVWNPLYGEQPAIYVNDEHRIFQQVQFKHYLKRIRFQHRLRIEERFLQRHHTEPDGTIVDEGYNNQQLRIRYRFLANIPINNNQEGSDKSQFDPKTLYIQLYDEVFISWGKSVTYHKPDQNRIFAGLGYQFTADFSAQAGFFYQMLIKANGAQQENNAGFAMFLVYNFDFTK